MLERFERQPGQSAVSAPGLTIKILRTMEGILGPSSLGLLAGLALLVLLHGVCQAGTLGHAARGLRPGAGQEGYFPVASEAVEEAP